MEAEYYRGPGHDRAKAIAAYERAMQLSDLRGNNLGLELMSRREFVRAESLFRADVLRDSSFLLSHNNVTTALINQGKLDEADSMLAVSRRRFPRSPAPRQQFLNVRYLRGQVADVQRGVDSARTASRGPDLSWALARSSELALLTGQVSRWRQYRNQAAANDSSIGRRRLASAQAASELAVLSAIGANRDAALQALDRSVAREPLASLPDAERPDVAVAIALASAGRPDRARAVLQALDATLRDTTIKRDMQPGLHTARGYIALAENRPAEAIAEFRRGDLRPDGPVNACAVCLPMNLARAFDAASQADSAIAQYERYLTTPFVGRSAEGLDAQTVPIAHERLGQLYEAKGQHDKAAEHYRKFIELWKNADAELQPRVRAAQERLRKLTPVERPR